MMASLARQAQVVHAHDGRSHTLAAAVTPERLVVSRRWLSLTWRNYRIPLEIQARGSLHHDPSEFVKAILESGGVPGSKISVVYDGVPEQQASPGGPYIVIPDLVDAGKGRISGDRRRQTCGCAGHCLARSRRTYIGICVRVSLAIESLGSAVLLAMAAGVPVIASNIGGLLEIVEHERTGLLTANTVGSRRDALRRLIGDPELARRISTSARANVANNFPRIEWSRALSRFTRR